jgi:outer membrane protein
MSTMMNSPFFFLRLIKFRMILLILPFLFSLSFSIVQAADRELTNVAVVNLNVLMDESPLAKQLSQQIQNDYSPREEELNHALSELRKLEEALNDNTAAFSEEERIQRSREFRDRKRKYTRDYEDFRDSLSNARQKAIELVRQEVMVAVDQVRKKEGIAVVFDNYLFASEDVDLTPKVLNYLQTLYANTPNKSESAPTDEKGDSLKQTDSGNTNNQDKQNAVE